MPRLLIAIFFFVLLSGCGDNFDRDELMNGPQDDGVVTDSGSPDDMLDSGEVSDILVSDDPAPDIAIPDDTVMMPGSVTVSATTSTYNGQYAPRNVFAIWLETAAGDYIRSLGVWAQPYRSKLTRWYQKSSYGSQGMTDAVTGASRMTHGTKTVTLDLAKYPVAPGNYKVWFELNETNFASRSTSSDITIGPGGTVNATNEVANINGISIIFAP